MAVINDTVYTILLPSLSAVRNVSSQEHWQEGQYEILRINLQEHNLGICETTGDGNCIF